MVKPAAVKPARAPVVEARGVRAARIRAAGGVSVLRDRAMVALAAAGLSAEHIAALERRHVSIGQARTWGEVLALEVHVQCPGDPRRLFNLNPQQAWLVAEYLEEEHAGAEASWPLFPGLSRNGVHSRFRYLRARQRRRRC